MRRLANSRKEAARLVQRARLITFMLDDPNLYAGEAGLKAGFRTHGSGTLWVRRFNEAGVAGLEGQPTGECDVCVAVARAGVGDRVLVLDEGNGARQVLNRKVAPVRAVIVGVVDDVVLEN